MKINQYSFALAAVLVAAFSTVGTVQAQGVNVTTGAVTEMATERTVAQIVAGMQFGSEARMEAIAGSDTVSFVTLSHLTSGDARNAAEVNAAIAGNSVDMDGLRAGIAGNAQIGAALAAQGLTAEDVVAVSLVSESDLVLVIDDKT